MKNAKTCTCGETFSSRGRMLQHVMFRQSMGSQEHRDPSHDRKIMARKRLARLKELRRLRAPRWVIKTEQIALALNRDGMRNAGLGRTMSKRQATLYAKHVTKFMNGGGT